MSSCDSAGMASGWAERSVSALPTWDHPVPARPGSEAHSALPGAVLTPWSAPVTFGGSQSVDCRPDGNRLQGARWVRHQLPTVLHQRASTLQEQQLTVPDLPVEAPRPVRLLFDHQFGSASLTGAHRHCRCRDRVPDRGRRAPSCFTCWATTPLFNRHGAGLHRAVVLRPAGRQARPAPS